MSLNPSEDIPKETHKKISQFIRIESGRGVAIINGKKYILKDDYKKLNGKLFIGVTSFYSDLLLISKNINKISASIEFLVCST